MKSRRWTAYRYIITDIRISQLNSTRRRVELSCVNDARRRSPTGVERQLPVSAKQVSSLGLFITLILLKSLYAFHLISYKHPFCCYSSISLFSNSSVQLSIIYIRSHSHTNLRISSYFASYMTSWPTNYFNWVTTFRTADAPCVGGSTTGSCRYKRDSTPTSLTSRPTRIVPLQHQRRCTDCPAAWGSSW